MAHRPDAPDAAQLTGLFAERFGPWADQVQQQAQADTNAPSLSPEDRAEIERLTDETVQMHEQILQTLKDGGPRPAEDQYQVLKNLVRIQELLPKDKNQQQSQSQQPQPNPQQKPEPQNPPEQPPEEKPDEQESPPEQQPEAKPDEPPPDVQEVLRRALEREKEHEADKRRQMREFPMAPNARDW